MKKKRGVFFSMDVLLAFILVILAVIVIFPIVKYRHQESFIQRDFLEVVSTLKTGEINNSYVQYLIAQGDITDLNKTLLEQMGELYITNLTIAKNLSNELLRSLNTSDNVGIWFGDKLLASKNKTSLNDAINSQVERRILSGISNGSGVTGYSARAFLTSSVRKKYFYFGGYVGEGNLSLQINYSGELEKADLEIATNTNFSICINDDGSENNCSGYFTPYESEFRPKNYSLDAYYSWFHNGTNLMEFIPRTNERLYIAGGHLKIAYKTNETFERKKRYSFPGINGIINLYDSFYIPGSLKQMEVSLHYDSNYTMFLNIGNVTVFNDSNNGETTEVIDNGNLSLFLDYNDLSNKTIPLRLGFDEFRLLAGNADVVLITDLSGSMNFDMVSENSGVTRGCSDPNLYDNDTKRISLAKCLDKMVVDMILNYSGNRLALVGFYGDAGPPNKGLVTKEDLTTNAAYLKNQIDAYSPVGGTPICAALNNAYKILDNPTSANKSKFVIMMSDGIPTHTCEAASGCEGTRDGISPEEALWIGGMCFGGMENCEDNNCSCAFQNSNWSACRLAKDLNTTIYSIGFGPVANCTNANKTLQDISNCGGGSYSASQNGTALGGIYKGVAEEILNLSYVSQVVNISGDINTTLYPDSYIEFNYSENEIPYGLVITAEEKFYNNYSGNFTIPDNSTIVEAIALSYSGPRWTDNVKINNNSIFNLSDYGSLFMRLGDPYNINIPIEFVNETEMNFVNITTALGPDNRTYGSEYNKIVYTIIKEMIAYSEITAFADGCNWTIEFEDGTNITIPIPPNYDGDDKCYYTNAKHVKFSSIDQNDAVQSAVFNLLEILDFDGDGRLDVKFTEQNFEIGSSQVTNIPYSWSTEVKVIRWD
jgi:hypothetical protein